MKLDVSRHTWRQLILRASFRGVPKSTALLFDRQLHRKVVPTDIPDQ